MTITPYENTIIVTTPNESGMQYCVYEHYMSNEPGLPPTLIFVGVDKLSDFIAMPNARNNTLWAKMTERGSKPLMIRLLAVTDDWREARDHAVKHIASLATGPICNVQGYNVSGARRPIICSNGIEYPSQLEAAKALGVSQSAISQHLRGFGKSVGGFTFAYKGHADDE